MAPKLYSLLAIGSILSSTYCLPHNLPDDCPPTDPYHRSHNHDHGNILSIQELQTKQPTLTGLASNANVTLFVAALGVGTQNYSCNGSEYVQTIDGSGAKANLFDITEYLEHNPDRIDHVAQAYMESENGSKHPGLSELLTSNYVGYHYFDFDHKTETNIPTLNLTQAAGAPVLSAAKIGDVKAPNSNNVDWLFLKDANDGISDGLVEAYRVDTEKGVLSDLTCKPGDKPKAIKYAAQYWFYK